MGGPSSPFLGSSSGSNSTYVFHLSFLSARQSHCGKRALQFYGFVIFSLWWRLLCVENLCTISSSLRSLFVAKMRYAYVIMIFAEGMTPEERRANYGCDITYVTNSELGFDFLRDNLATVSLKVIDFVICFAFGINSFCGHRAYKSTIGESYLEVLIVNIAGPH